LRLMGLLHEGCATLLSPLRRGSPHAKAGGAKAWEDSRDVDVWDIMEKGLARELVADFMEPLPEAAFGLWKFSVERSEDRTEHRLYCNGSEFLMYAKLARDLRRIDIHLYDPTEASNLFDAQRPAFSMTCNSARTEWSLYRDRCDNCRHTAARNEVCRCCGGRSELLRVRHEDVEIGDGVNHCMDVYVPSTRSDPNVGETIHLVSKMPTWNDSVECLVLDFKGRNVLASAKNFQLAVDGDDLERVVCQYSKVGGRSFGLDFTYPLTVAQAFGISLSTAFWA